MAMEESIFNIDVRASFRGHSLLTRQNLTDFDIPIGMSVSDIQDEDLVDANSFFDAVISRIHTGFKSSELLYIEIITSPVSEHKMFAGLTDIPNTMYEPEWMQKKHIYYFKDWKIIDDSESDIIVIESKSKVPFNYYMVASETGFERNESLSNIRKQYKELTNLRVYTYTQFMQILGVAYYNKEHDAFYSTSYSTLRKLSLSQKVKVLRCNSSNTFIYIRRNINAFLDRLIYYYTIPAQIVYSFVVLWEPLKKLIRGEINIFDLNNINVEIGFKLKMVLLFLSTLLYAYIIYIVLRHN